MILMKADGAVGVAAREAGAIYGLGLALNGPPPRGRSSTIDVEPVRSVLDNNAITLNKAVESQ